MKVHLLSAWHHLVAVLPGTWHQWAGAVLLVVLSFILPRTKQTKANSLIEAIINGLLATPGVGALLKAVPVLGAVVTYLGTQSVVTTTVTTTTDVKPPADAPAAPAGDK